MSEKSFFREVAVHAAAYGIVYSLLGIAGLIGLGAWLTGSVAALWGEFLNACRAVWAALTATLPVPVWVILIAFAFGVGFVLRSRRDRRTARPPIESFFRNPEPPPLGDLAQAILLMLVNEDGVPVDVTTIPGRVGATNLRTEIALEELERADLIEAQRGRYGQAMAGLSIKGRKLALERGYVPEWRPPASG